MERSNEFKKIDEIIVHALGLRNILSRLGIDISALTLAKHWKRENGLLYKQDNDGRTTV